MKALYRLLVMLLVVSMLVVSFTGCDKLFGKDDETSENGGSENGDNENSGNENGSNNTGNNEGDNGNTEVPKEFVDYVSTVKFNPNSGRKYIETTVKLYIDGDTTHFNVPNSISETGVLKARYLGVNTPESTGQIEPWGKKASNFTRSKLESATSIIVESNDGNWNNDSTGERYLVWIWYKSADMTDYKNLNLEILQEGLAKGSSSDDSVYADVCSSILNQSIQHKLHVFSQEKDPGFYYGDAQPITLKELKMNISQYKDQRVAFEGVVVRAYDNTTVYVEEYDEQTGEYFGMQVYYGYNLNWFGKEILKVGNRVIVAGSVQYYENGGTWQISDIKYDPNPMNNSSENIKKIDDGHTGSYREIDAGVLNSGKLDCTVVKENEDGTETVLEKTLDYGFVTVHSTASLKNLTIKSVYTTQQGESKGAMSITCEDENGNTIVVRTVVLIDSATQEVITADYFKVGSVMDVKGVIDYFDGSYQLKLFNVNDVTFK